MAEKLHSDVLERLQQDVVLSETARELVLAALLGEVEACLGGKTSVAPATESAEPENPARAYINAVRVQGFRGIGPSAELALSPGPGLTLVVGRNGSGKSSFAEALELLLTGDNQRWSSKRSRVWKDGWRNLHEPDVTKIEATLLIDGQAGPYVASRQWSANDTLEAGEATITHAHKRKTGPLSQLGWATPLATYRPFLSYNELGSMLEEGPSRLFDALASILGLEELVAAADALKDARGSRSKIHKKAKDKLKELRASLKAHPDERAAKCLEATKGAKWNLDAVEGLVAGGAVSDADSRPSRGFGSSPSFRGRIPSASPSSSPSSGRRSRIDRVSLERMPTKPADEPRFWTKPLSSTATTETGTAPSVDAPRHSTRFGTARPRRKPRRSEKKLPLPRKRTARFVTRSGSHRRRRPPCLPPY